jgi:hypothetical protein
MKIQDLTAQPTSVTHPTTSPPDPLQDETATRKNAAVLLGRLGGLKGGKARAAKLSKEARSEIARRAARARWKNATTKDEDIAVTSTRAELNELRRRYEARVSVLQEKLRAVDLVLTLFPSQDR